jgi:RNA polymerase sigma-70 factor (ECF subfamily)
MGRADAGRADELAGAYEAARPRLVRLAYTVLGTIADAQDVVQDVWLRLVAADAREAVRDVDAWATVAVARAALDAAQSARRRRETYIGPWLPEPVLEDGPTTADPADRVTLDDTVRFALLVVLESLTPAERTSWVLHDLFGVPFDEVAGIVGRSPAAVRQLAVRARSRLEHHRPRVQVDPGEHSRTVERFVRAVAGGDLRELVSVLDPEVVLVSDGGGKVSTARRPVLGADRVARLLLGLTAKAGSAGGIRPLTVNGLVAFGLLMHEVLVGVLIPEIAHGRVARIDMVMTPDKLPAR